MKIRKAEKIHKHGNKIERKIKMREAYNIKWKGSSPSFQMAFGRTHGIDMSSSLPSLSRASLLFGRPV